MAKIKQSKLSQINGYDKYRDSLKERAEQRQQEAGGASPASASSGGGSGTKPAKIKTSKLSQISGYDKHENAQAQEDITRLGMSMNSASLAAAQQAVSSPDFLKGASASQQGYLDQAERDIAAIQSQIYELEQFGDLTRGGEALTSGSFHSAPTRDDLRLAELEEQLKEASARKSRYGQTVANLSKRSDDVEHAAQGAGYEALRAQGDFLRTVQQTRSATSELPEYDPAKEDPRAQILVWAIQTAEKAKKADGGQSAIKPSDMTMRADQKWDRMTEDEVNVLLYYAGKGQWDEAERYLDWLEETVNYREGQRLGESVRGIDNGVLRTLATGGYGLYSGVDQFVGGVAQAFSDERLPTSAVQYGSQYVMEDLADTGPRIAGKSLGQYAYGATNTIGNMAPSILASTLTGGLGASAAVASAVAAGTMGLSASGHAYAQALDDGYSKGQARTYAALVGASEAGLQYLLGGISKLGGVTDDVLLSKVAAFDSGLKRAVGTGLVKLGSEITEEELQGFVEPLLRTVVFGEEYDPPTIEEMVETAIVTALSTGVLEGGNIVNAGRSRPAGSPENGTGTGQDGAPAAGEGMDIPVQQGASEGKINASTGEAARNENGLAPLTEQEKVNLSSGKRNKIVSTFSEAVAFVKNALTNKQSTDRAYLGKVPDKVAAQVLADTGVDIKGRSAILPSDNVRHIIKQHGNQAQEAARGQAAVTVEDIALIPQVLSAPDKVALSPQKDSRGRPVLVFEKQIGDNYVTMQAVADGSRSIQTDTLYKQKMKSPQGTEYYNAGVSADPAHNAQSVPPQGSSTNPTIPQSAGGVNSQYAQAGAENQGGVRLYGVGTGDNVSDGDGGRLSGAGAGEQAGKLEQGAKAKRQAAQQQRAAVDRENRVNGLRAQKVSSAQLGIEGGTDAANLAVMPESAWDEGLRATAERVYKETGHRVTYVIGSIQVQGADGQRHRVKGVYNRDGIILQANHYTYSVDQIADHEIFHDKSLKEPRIIREMFERVRERYGEEEFYNVAAVYVEKLRGVVDVREDADVDADMEAFHEIIEEIFADAYAGMNAFGAGATQFTEEVHRTLAERGMGRGSEYAAATEHTTGPPQERYSIDYDEDNRPFVVVEEDILDGVPQSRWIKTVKDNLRKNFPNGVTVGNNQIKINAQTTSEITSSEYSKWIRDNAPTEYADKLRATNNADEILRASRDYVGEALKHPRKDNIREFARGTVQMRVGGRDYTADVVVGTTSSGSMVLYDILNMHGTTINEKKRSRTAATTETGISDRTSANASKASIPKSGEKGKSKFSVDDEPQFRRVKPEAADKRVKQFQLGAKVSPYGLGIPGGSRDRTLQVVTGGDSTETKAARALIEERGLKPVLFVGGDLTTTGKSGQQAESWGFVADGTAYIRADHPSYTAKDIAGQMFGLREQVETQKRKPKEKPRKKARGEKVTKPPAESKPSIAKKEFRQNLLSLFSIPEGWRADLGKVIDSYADRILKDGALTVENRRALFDRLYESGVMSIAADEYYQFGRETLLGRRIYVSERDKAEFGGSEEWNDFRKRAFAAGVYLTNNKGDNGIDALNMELATAMPGLFDPTELDNRTILERIVQVAEEGQDEKVSLAEYTARLAQEEYVPEEQLLDSMERQLDWALRSFAEKASLEIRLRDRTGVKLAQERADRQEQNRRQRERRELAELQQRTLKQLQWLSKNRYRAPADLKAAFDEVLGDLDLYAVGAANEMNWSRKYQATWKDLLEMYQDAKANDPNFVPSKDLKIIEDRLKKAKLSDLEVGDLQDLYKMAVGLRTEYYNRNNVINDEMHRQFAEVFADSKEEFEGAKRKFSLSKLKEFINQGQLTPMNMLQMMVGWNPKSTFYTAMARQLEKGERDMRAYIVGANRMLEGFITEHEDWLKRADGQGKDAIWYELEVSELLELGKGDKPIFGDTVKIHMTPIQKAQMYVESKSMDNLLHMMGGRTFVNKELYSKGNKKEAFAQGRTVKLAPETVKKLVANLTEEELALAAALEPYYNVYAPERINRVSNVVSGFDKARGGYYAPINTDKSYTGTEFGVFDGSAENVGHMKGRIPYSKTPSLNISALDAFERHRDQVARYVGMAIPTRNWETFLNWSGQNTTTKKVIEDSGWGKAGLEYIEDIINRLQGGVTKEKDGVGSAVDKLFSKYISATFGFNPSIVTKQLGSIFMAMPELGIGNMPSLARGFKPDKELIRKYTSELDWRGMGYATPETRTLTENPGKLRSNKAVQFLFDGGAITAADQLAAGYLWPWAENKVRKENPNLEVGTREQIDAGQSPFYQKVAEVFNDAVSRSQSASDETHQSQMRKSRNAFSRALTMFKSDAAQGYNQLRQKIGEARYYARSGADKATVRKAKKAAGAAAVGILSSNLWAAIMSFLVALWKNQGKYYRDEEDELTAESVLTEGAATLLGNVAGLVAGGEELAELIGNLITGDKWYGIDVPGMEQVTDLTERAISIVKGAGKFVSGISEIVDQGGDIGAYIKRNAGTVIGGIKEVAQLGATYFGGVPVSNIEAYLLGPWRWIAPEFVTAYEDALSGVDKSGLSGLKGKALEQRMESLLDSRLGEAEEETAAALASLYEAGYKTAAPSDTPDSITVKGEDHKLDAYQKQLYEMAWKDAVAGALDELVASGQFEDADGETRARMVKKLYDYGAELAKEALFDEYEADQWVTDTRKAGRTGESAADIIAWRVLTGDRYDSFVKMTGAGLAEEDALEVTRRIEKLKPEAGKDSVSSLQKYRAVADMDLSEEDKAMAMVGVMPAESLPKFQVIHGEGVATDDYVSYLEIAKQADEDDSGSLSQAEVTKAINALPGLSTEERAVLWQAANKGWLPKSNPFSRSVGQRVYDALNPD